MMRAEEKVDLYLQRLLQTCGHSHRIGCSKASLSSVKN